MFCLSKTGKSISDLISILSYSSQISTNTEIDSSSLTNSSQLLPSSLSLSPYTCSPPQSATEAIPVLSQSQLISLPCSPLQPQTDHQSTTPVEFSEFSPITLPASEMAPLPIPVFTFEEHHQLILTNQSGQKEVIAAKLKLEREEIIAGLNWIDNNLQGKEREKASGKIVSLIRKIKLEPQLLKRKLSLPDRSGVKRIKLNKQRRKFIANKKKGRKPLKK